VTRPHPWLHAFLDVPDELAEPAVRFWAAATGAAIGAPWPDHPEFRSLEPVTGSRYLHVQRHGGPPRLHLDLTTPDVDAETARLVALGATVGHRERWWQVLGSPGGLPFCLVEETEGRRRPDPVRWPNGRHSRVSQFVLDVPSGRYEAEWEFWRGATGWSRRSGRRPEFRCLLGPESSPLGLLLRRRVEDGTGPVRGHLCIGADDVDAEVRRLIELGGVVEADRADHVGSWALLTDPVGLPFCVIPLRS
jgi:predicted enzyme related to lactoylglutathione lyase